MVEEVRDPQRTIPRAIPIALLIAVAMYLVVGVPALLDSGPGRLATATAPLTTAVRSVGTGTWPRWCALVALGALLALIAGIGRTSSVLAGTVVFAPA